MCQNDRCSDSRVYQNGDIDQPIQVCSGHGLCSDHGCVCTPGFSGRNCSLVADCTGGSGDVDCSGHGTCAGGPGICNGKENCPDPCTCHKSHEIIYTGVHCQTAICPGPINELGVINECSGKGHCGQALDTGKPKCTCVSSAVGGSYRDFDCMTPPSYFVADVTPFVGPVEGGTHIRIKGPGLDRIISRNHLIQDWRNAKNHLSLFCQFEMSDEDDNSWTLPLTPALWHATVVQAYVPFVEEAAQHHLEIHPGDEVVVYGCNPCNSKDARLVAETADGVLGFIPADLYYYDSEFDWDTVVCDSPPSYVTGYAKVTLTGQTVPTPPAAAIMGKDINVDTLQPFEYYKYEIIQRLKPTKSPLRPVGTPRGPPDIDLILPPEDRR